MLSAPCDGCAEYRPQPIDLGTVEERLAVPPPESLRLEAERIEHPILKPLELDLSDGLSPDEAAVLAVLLNPSLRAARDKQGVANAQLLAAGILPNPQVSLSLDQPYAGSTAGTVTAWGLGVDYDISALITRGAGVDAARAEAQSVALDIAWQEWQAAEDAKLHVVRLEWLQRQLQEAIGAENRVEANLARLGVGVNAGWLTRVEQDAARAQLERYRLTTLEVFKSLEEERLALCETIGLPPSAPVNVNARGSSQPSPPPLPAQALAEALDAHRLDLIALRLGYQAQEAKLRGAVLSQFPKISIGVNSARDTSNVVTAGVGVTLDLPLFDRGQGRIAIETATRQQLFDEYVARSFEARIDVMKVQSALALADRRLAATNALVEQTEALQTTYQSAMTAGAADILKLYEVQDALSDARLEALKLEQERAEMLIGLEVATGQILERAP